MKIQILLFSLIISATSIAQQFSVDWYKMAGGGGTSTSGVYSVSGTIGQHDAGGPVADGQYSLTGGFWSLISVVQAPGLPSLTITHSGNHIIIWWPNTGSYILQQNTNPAVPGGWTTSNFSISTVNGTNSVIVMYPKGNLFFRLRQP